MFNFKKKTKPKKTNLKTPSENEKKQPNKKHFFKWVLMFSDAEIRPYILCCHHCLFVDVLGGGGDE